MGTTERGLLMLSPLLLLLLMLLLPLMLMPGMDTTATASTMAMDTTDTGLMAMDTTTERGLPMLSPLLRLLLPLRLIPGMDTTVMDTGLMATTGLMAMDTVLMAMDTADTGLMAMDTTMERGLLMLSLLLMLLLPPRPRLIPGTDTTAMATGLMAMDTTDTGLMATTGERSKECNFCQTAAN